jgi:hypothetical protein
VDRRRPDVQEELRFAREIPRAVDPALPAQAVELKQEVLLLGAGEERRRGMQLGALGPARQGLVAVDGVRRDVDDGLVDRSHLPFQNQVEEALAPAALGDPFAELGVVARLLERLAQLGLGAEGRVAQGRGRSDGQRRVLSHVGIADAVASPVNAARKLARQTGKLPPVEIQLVGLAKDEYEDLVSTRLTRDDHVADAEAIADQVRRQRSQRTHGALVGLAAEAALDLGQRRSVNRDQPQGAVL